MDSKAKEEQPAPSTPASEAAKPSPKLPEPKSPKTSSWKKFEERQTQRLLEEKQKQLMREQQERIRKEQETKQKQLYGYIPFKAPPAPIYEARPQSKQGMVPAAANRSGSALGSINFQTVQQIRPPSEMGTYRPVSRFHSFSTLPRPDYLDVESLYGMSQAMPPNYIHDHGHSVDATRPGSKLSFSYAGEFKRPASAMSGINIQPAFVPGNPGYPINEDQIPTKEIIDWSVVNLSSCLQFLFGLAIFAVGACRMMLRAENAKGQELFFAISVMISGIFGYFSVRSQSYTMVMWCFVHSLINAVFTFVPLFTGVLALLPYLNTPNKTIIGNTNEPVEVDITLIVLSILELATALVISLYGCRAAGRTMQTVVHIRHKLLRMETL
ncbi:unnamed protein product [Bursaphelenchus xylophilus]|uniref:(pine wood nematode) hypothetical protein n=1 Tax=Bursaphelenchus xylophilus TaxID=6326 RepID=A0A1I7RNK4_BURXY|nr:unnamed protein product [Bursaphelenchus xylophilus]CAG9124114.1 unnamed protein product [Bursaphelenchus xylophilus]